MRTLVNNKNFDAVVQALMNTERMSLDTETTGLLPFHGDRLFSIVMADKDNEYYFDFSIGGIKKDKETAAKMQALLDSIKYIFLINADFDYSMLHFDGIKLNSKLLDGGVMARLEYSLHQPQGKKSDNQFFSMDYLAKWYLKLSKDTSVENYIKEHNLYGVDIYDKKKPLYARVPLDIMFNYGCRDARITYDVCIKILEQINARDHSYKDSRPKSFKKIINKLANESALTTALAETKIRGMVLNTEYCKEAQVYELENARVNLAEIKKTVDLNVNSPKQMQKYLREDLGLELPKIIKKGKWTGGYSTDAETLFMLGDKHDLPVLNNIVSAKRSQKKANTYYKNYLKMIDEAGIIHCSLGQETTTTGRLSSFQPNLQNVPKEDFHKWAVRNSFKRRDNYTLFFFDYKGQEMYIMIDLSGDQQVIDQVASGVDIYIAMAQMVERYTGLKISRSQAKALALGVAYGQGIKLIAANLKCAESEAKTLRGAFRKSLQGVNDLDAWCKRQAKLYGKIHNPYGRVSIIERGFEYKTLNALIQGTAADCTKAAFVSCFELLKDYKSKIDLTVHDEIIFSIHDNEHHLLPEISRLMVEAYPHRHLPLRVDIESSKTTWGAKADYVA